jgi:uroporphyrinogen decarboxylase
MGTGPDFERIRKTLLLQGEPDRVPCMEQTVDRDVKKAFMGRPIRTLEDEVEFWMSAGFDYVPLAVGMRTAIRIATGVVQAGAGASDFSKSLKVAKSRYSVIEDEERERGWAEEGTGMIAGREEFDSIKWPDPDAMDYSPFEEVKRYLPPGARVIASMGYVYSTVIRLMGFQNFCEKLIEDPDLVARVFEKAGEIQLGVFRNVVKLDVVGATWHPDDIAYSTGLMVAPRHLRKHMWPWYAEMCRISWERDLPIIFHSDGKLDEVMNDIVEAGFTSLHPIEPKAMDIVAVKREFGDRLSLIGNIDLAYTLTRGTPEEVEQEVRMRIEQVAPGGGYAVGSANSVTEYVPVENFRAMLDATRRHGRYPIGAS